MQFLQAATWSPIIIFLLTQSTALILGGIAIYIRIMTRLRELEIRVDIIEKNEMKIFEKLDELLEAVHRVEIKLAKVQGDDD